MQRASLFPSFNAQASASDGHRRRNERQCGDNWRKHRRYGTTGAGFSGSYQPFSTGLSLASFELDLFGRVHNLTQTQLQFYLASEAGQRNMRLSIVTQTAVTWVTLAADRSLLEISEQTVHSAGASVTGGNKAAARDATACDARSGSPIIGNTQSCLPPPPSAVPKLPRLKAYREGFPSLARISCRAPVEVSTVKSSTAMPVYGVAI